MKKKWNWKLILLMLLMLTLFSGCSPLGDFQSEPDDGTIELWVVTEKNYWDGMNGQARTLIEEFEETHENVTFKLDILPLDADEREIYLEQLRVQIMSGKGPDVYLLPTSSWSRADSPNRRQEFTVEKLFQDEYLTMYNGHFTDISEYYDTDEALGKEELVTEIMNAGVVGDARYILPLRYDYPVIYAATDRLETLHTDLDVLKSGVITDIMDLAIETSNGGLANGADTVYVNYEHLIHFPQCMDYERGEVVLNIDEVAELVEDFKRIQTLPGYDPWHESGSEPAFGGKIEDEYIKKDEHLGNTSYVLMAGYLHNIVEIAAVSKAAGVDLTMIPVRNGNGDLVANVTYYGAVGSSCAHPETAYEFLRLFLLGESQWELNRLRDNVNRPRGATLGYIEEGWPVRSVCDVSNFWEMFYMQYAYRGDPRSLENFQQDFISLEGSRPRFKKILNLELTEEDFSVLDVPIDQVMFDLTFGMDLRELIKSSNDSYEVAEELIKKLELHIAEG